MSAPNLFATVAALALAAGCVGTTNTDGGSTSAADAGTGTLDCAGLRACIAACSTAACQSDCRGRADTMSQALADGLSQCDTTHDCRGDNNCLRMQCGAQLTACQGSGGFPARLVGTLTDLLDEPGGFGRLESTGQATFVRDDAANPTGSSGFAFYRLENVTYTAVASGVAAGGCTQQANQTVTFTNPPAAQNLVAIRLQADANGRHAYEVTTALSQPFPDGLTLACPGNTSTTQFNAELNLSTGPEMPTTTNPASLVGSYVESPERTLSWDLQGQ